MTLPNDPQNTSSNNADDPFGGMDMMAWMESLAKRQGASSDELTTAADIDVPLPPPDAVVTGPGYTPGYEMPKSKAPAAAVPASPQPAPASVTPPAPTPVAAPPVQAAPVAAKTADPNDPFGGMDMMAWMESLAKRQGASSDELTTAANIDIPMPPADSIIDEPGYTPGYEVSKSKAQVEKPAAVEPIAASLPPPVPAPEPVQTAQTAAAVTVDPNDPLGGMDMMAWMESLARRQGASSDELTTAANMEIPLPPADTVIDEPGYTPGYEVSKSKVSVTSATSPALAAMSEPVEPLAPAASLAVESSALPTVAQPVSDPFAVTDQMADPMAWLETLAKRQGARSEELMTSADMNIPEPPANTVIDEPGYSDYSPFGSAAPASDAMDTPSMSSAEAAELLGLSDKAAEPNPLSSMDPLAWLESLAAPQAADHTDFSSFNAPTSETSEAMEAASALSWLEQLASEAQAFPYQVTETPSGSIITPAPEPDITESWVDTTPARADELGGLSDDMNQLQQWLAAQANSLAEVHDRGEDLALAPEQTESASEYTDASFGDAAPGEIPDWLREHMPGSSVPPSSQIVAAPLTEIFDEPAIPADLPSWLLENVSPAVASDPFGFDTPSASTEPEAAHDYPTEVDVPSDYDFAGSIQPAVEDQLSSDDLSDPWVEAFEYEESRRLAGDENELPDWYTDALARSGDPSSVAILAEPTSTDLAQPEAQADVLAPNDYPAWLTGLTADDDEADAELTGVSSGNVIDVDEPNYDSEPIMAGDLPSWLIDSLPDSSGLDLGTVTFESNQFETATSMDLVDLPDWLRPPEPEVQPPSAPTPVPVAVVVPPTPPAPEPVPVATITPAAPAIQPEPPVSVQTDPTVDVSAPKIAAPDVRDFWGAAQSIATSLPVATTPAPAVPPPTPAPPAPVSTDHAEKLQRARELVAQGQYRESLTHYQSLIDSEAALDHVISDMQNIVQAQPTDPAAHRLLGDAHLRKGNLQDALDTYRKALDQL